MNVSAREPLAIRAAVVGAVTAALHVAVVLGYAPEALAQHEAEVAGAFDVIGTAVLVVWTRGHVTPTASVAASESATGDLEAGPAADAHSDEDVAEGEPVEVTALPRDERGRFVKRVP